MTEIREIGEDELDAFVRVINETLPDDDATPAGAIDWRRQAEDMIWLLADADGHAVGAGVALIGWHIPREVAIARPVVLPAARRRGVGSALLARLAAWAAKRRATQLQSDVREVDADSLAWAERRGFREVGRESRLVLDLQRVDPPEPDPPPGIEIVAWAERPELARGMYEVALEATVDIPGSEDEELGTFEEWLSRDMQGIADRPEATFVAVAGDEVVGFAKFSIPERGERAYHDLTGVKRAWRGRGIAAALKRTQIGWAKRQGYRELVTGNEERNEPIRRLNQRYGYVVQPGHVIVRGPIRL